MMNVSKSIRARIIAELAGVADFMIVVLEQFRAFAVTLQCRSKCVDRPRHG
jgi:hypothetical protein